MKKLASLFAVIALSAGILSLPMTVNAASSSSADGLDVSMETELSSYALDESGNNKATEVVANVSVKNTNAYDVNEVEVKFELPSGLTLKAGKLVETGIEVPASETHVSSITAVKFESTSGGNETGNNTNGGNNTENAADDIAPDIESPRTGDSFNPTVVLIIMLFAASFILVAVKRGARVPKSVVSLVLCFVVASFALNTTVIRSSGKG